MRRRNCAIMPKLPLASQQVDMPEGMSPADTGGQSFQISAPYCVLIPIVKYAYGLILKVEINVSAVALHNSSENQNLMFATLHHFCVGISESPNCPCI